MKTPLIALCALISACAMTDDEPDGVSRAVVGGVPDYEHTSVVAIVGRRGQCSSAERLVCSGVVIGERAVLTAAHCLQGVEPDELEVIVADSTTPPPLAVYAVWGATVHPAYDVSVPAEASRDAAVLVTEADLGVPPAPVPTRALGEISIGAQVRVVGFGSERIDGPAGTRLTADARVTSAGTITFWTGDTGVPCGGDSGGATFVDTADGEVLAGIVKASGADCADEALHVRIDTALDYVSGALADAAALVSPGRPPLDSSAKFCADPCTNAADCPLGMLCLPEQGGSRCGYRDIRPRAFGGPCRSAEATCVSVGQGSERDCREAQPCDEQPGDDGGCAIATGSAAPEPWCLVLAVLALVDIRGRSTARRQRTKTPRG